MDENLQILFGLKMGLTLYQFGTKGDMITFFAVIEDLIKNGRLNSDYPTFTIDLKTRCIHEGNILQFGGELNALTNELKIIATNTINWDQYPMNTRKFAYDLTKPNVYDVFEKIFIELKEEVDYYPEAKEKGYKFRTMYVSPEL